MDALAKQGDTGSMKNLLLILIFFLLGITTISAQQVFDDTYKKRLDEEYSSALFRDRNAYVFVPSGDPAAIASQTVFQYLQGRVPGMRIENTQLWSPRVYWRNAKTIFFLNEMRVDAATISLLNINDIGLVKVFRPPFVGGIGNSPGGAVAVWVVKAAEDE